MENDKTKIVLNAWQLKLLNFVTSTALITFLMLEDYRDSLESSAIEYSNKAKGLGKDKQKEKDVLLSQSIKYREDFNKVKKLMVSYSKTYHDSKMFKHQMAKHHAPNEYLKIPNEFSNVHAEGMIEIFNPPWVKEIKSKVGIYDFFDVKIQSIILNKDS